MLPRGRGETEFFLDTRALDREIEQDQRLATEQEQVEARMAHLATRLTRQSVKTNALDYVAEGEQARSRQRELSHEL